MKNPTVAACVLAPALAAAQAPTVEFRPLSAPPHSGLPISLPDGQNAETVTCLAPGVAYIGSSQGRTFLADGVALTEICVDGTPVPGQPAGTLWRPGIVTVSTFPAAGREPIFHHNVFVPAVGFNVPRAFMGDPAGPLWQAPAPGSITRCTATRLVASALASGEVRVGPVQGPPRTIVPPGFIPPDFRFPIARWGDQGLLLNAAGQVAGAARLTDGTVVIAAVDEQAFRVVTDDRQTLPSDRGPLVLSNAVIPLSQPLADGSLVLGDSVMLDGLPRSAIWVTPPAGPSSVIAARGDHTPGLPAGITLGTPVFLVASRNGNLLWGAPLIDDIHHTQAGGAVFLRSGGRSRLILRSRTPIAGAPDGALVPDFLPDSLVASSQVNDLGAVALIYRADPNNVAYLYTPESGTVELLRTLGTFRSPSYTTRISGVTQAYGTPAGVRWNSGGDDDRPSFLDADGSIFLAVSAFTGAFAATARITAPGCRPDYNADGFLDFFDYDAFLDCFEGGGGGCPNGKDADFNNDDFADFFDYADFIDAFERGC